MKSLAKYDEQAATDEFRELVQEFIPEGVPSNGQVEATWAVAYAINKLATAVNKLGLNDAATPMGAIEALAKQLEDGVRVKGVIGTHEAE